MQGIVVEKQGNKVRVNTRTWVLDRQEKPVIEADMMKFAGEMKKAMFIASRADVMALDLGRQYKKVVALAAKKKIELSENDSPSFMDTLSLLFSLGRKSVILKLIQMKKAKMYRYISNPFLLYLDGLVDFHTARTISLRTALPLGLRERIQAYLFFILDEAYKNGMGSMTMRNAIYEVSSLLDIDEENAEMYIIETGRDGQKGKKRIAFERDNSESNGDYDLADRDLEDDGKTRIYLAGVYFMKLKAIEMLNGNEGIQPDPGLKDRNMKELLSHRYSILTGDPGTGKTTLLRKIAEASGLKCIMAGLTGKAAQRMGQGAMTIHSILGFGPKGFSVKKLDCDLLIVDEASMLDWRTLYAILKAAPRVIFSGDPKQLPPVEGENVFQKMITATPHVRLTKKWRFMDGHEVQVIRKESDKKIFSVLANLAGRLKDKSFQVITPIHGGLLGTQYLNTFLQKMCNPMTESAGVNGVKPEDKVIVNRNIYTMDRKLVAANGTIGHVTEIRMEDKDPYCKINTGQKEVWVKREHIDLAYALTVHKYQGSECDYIIFILPDREKIREGFVTEEMVTVGKTRGRVRTYLLETMPDGDTQSSCYVCGERFSKDDMQNCGNGVYRCQCHRTTTILKMGNAATA
jgi:hypothetical protein